MVRMVNVNLDSEGWKVQKQSREGTAGGDRQTDEQMGRRSHQIVFFNFFAAEEWSKSIPPCERLLSVYRVRFGSFRYWLVCLRVSSLEMMCDREKLMFTFSEAEKFEKAGSSAEAFNLYSRFIDEAVGCVKFMPDNEEKKTL